MVKITSKIRVLLIAGAMCAYIAPNALAQAADANEATYHELLQQIADAKISIGQQQVFVANVNARIESLTQQLDGLDDVTKTVAPMLDKMVAGIDAAMKADFPFKMDERGPRLQRMKELVADDTATIGAKYRRVLNVYKIEVNYGQGLEAYKGNHPVSPTVREGDDRYKKDENGNVELNEKTGQKIDIFDGDYLRYGRTAFVYLNNDNSSPLRFDLATREWMALKGSEATEVRHAMRISYGEVAPGVVTAPVFTMP
ncbi:MAG: hypothetical protein COA43_09890 [Robiginitomaculum sp.]|nr:MAG: hypothetical protein COA43_09890 [Robiginitomaculum sp.]